MDSRPYGDLQFQRVANNLSQIRETARQIRQTLDSVRAKANFGDDVSAATADLSRRPPRSLGYDRDVQHPTVPRFSQHELAILRLIADGHGNEEIADQLHFGHGTIKLHVRGILEKLDTSSRTVAAVRAVRLGII
jgi:DNA-binding NarL/FixJ family response regulator